MYLVLENKTFKTDLASIQGRVKVKGYGKSALANIDRI